MAAKKGGPPKSQRKAMPKATKRGASGKFTSRKK